MNIREIANLQEDWKKLMASGKVTKKAICELCVPFRDQHGLTDRQTLQLARNELSLSEIADLVDAPCEEKGENPMLEIEKMLTISTFHVKPMDGVAFLEAEAECCRTYALTVYDKDEFGWFVYINTDVLAENRNEIPKDLLDCIDLALENGCRILCLDRDANEAPTLPSYEWD